MPRLEPFRAAIYDRPDGDLTGLLSPPYDMLDEPEKQQLLRTDAHNIVAIDLPVTPPKTVGPDHKYAAAARTLGQWLDEGVLRRDAEPAVFACEQQFDFDGRTYRRRGLLTTLRLEPFGRTGGGIHGHERTFKRGTDDRMKLTEATQSQLSPVFGVYSDPNRAVDELLSPMISNRPPDLSGQTARDGVTHRCWRIGDTKAVAALQDFFAVTDVFIADGHHRYSTALNYHQAHADNAAADRCLFALVACQDEGVIVLPSHRVVCGLEQFSIEQLQNLIDQRDDLTLRPTDHGPEQLAGLTGTLTGAGRHAMGLYDPVTRRTFVLSASTDDPLAAHIVDRPAVWRQLDVAVLHELLIDRVLRPAFGGEQVSFMYTADLDEMRRLSEAEPGRLAVMLQPTPFEAVIDVSRTGQLMPPKSTFFWPKVPTGLAIWPMF